MFRRAPADPPMANRWSSVWIAVIFDISRPNNPRNDTNDDDILATKVYISKCFVNFHVSAGTRRLQTGRVTQEILLFSKSAAQITPKMIPILGRLQIYGDFHVSAGTRRPADGERVEVRKKYGHFWNQNPEKPQKWYPYRRSCKFSANFMFRRAPADPPMANRWSFVWIAVIFEISSPNNPRNDTHDDIFATKVYLSKSAVLAGSRRVPAEL